MKNAKLSLKILLILILGILLPVSLLMFPPLLFGGHDMETTRIGWGYLAIFLVSAFSLGTIIKKSV